ncbi:MAG: 30S ribosomal protein S17e [Candidatus Caldarchaeum sp.]|nr:30S ribosomal protein S17e [Candidatus Caldarchaeum sp.]MCX8201083.1 30S ribosomal protein S17e [Candidatus Caldarchaeum sp.]
MGKVRTRKVKTLAKAISEAYADRVSASFEENKKLVREALAGRFSKKLSNRIAGYLVTLKKLELKKEKAAAAEKEAVEPSPTEP